MSLSPLAGRRGTLRVVLPTIVTCILLMCMETWWHQDKVSKHRYDHQYQISSSFFSLLVGVGLAFPRKMYDGSQHVNDTASNSSSSAIQLKDDSNYRHDCFVTQHGHDGLGHQLHGLISVMALDGLLHPIHGKYKFRFDATPRAFSFTHDLSPETYIMAQQFMMMGMKMAMTSAHNNNGSNNYNDTTLYGNNNTNQTIHNQYRHAYYNERTVVPEWWNIPDNCPTATTSLRTENNSQTKRVTFEIDNVWSLIPPLCMGDNPISIHYNNSNTTNSSSIARDKHQEDKEKLAAMLFQLRQKHNPPDPHEDDDPIGSPPSLEHWKQQFLRQQYRAAQQFNIALQTLLEINNNNSNPYPSFGNGDKHTSTVAVHIRLGDSTTRGRKSLDRALSFLWSKLESHEEQQQNYTIGNATSLQVWIDTDEADTVEQLLSSNRNVTTRNANIHIYGRNASVLEALGRFVRADTFIGSHSSLSMAAVLMRHQRPNTFLPQELRPGGNRAQKDESQSSSSSFCTLLPVDHIDWYWRRRPAFRAYLAPRRCALQ